MNNSYTIITLLLLLLVNIIYSQQVGTATAEVHPPLTTYSCTKAGCTPQSQSVVIDANWRWTHSVGGYTNCFSGTWDPKLCPDPVTCAKNCALEGASYASTYGITTSGTSLSLQYVVGSNQGSRVYLMEDTNTYQLLKLKNREFSFDVDVSQLECGMNGALYLVEMAADGGKSQNSNNAAGAAYGTGYCDAQCPQDVKFINGQANVLDWNGATGRFGSCCAEMDLWEANSASAAYTSHACRNSGLYMCNATECGNAGSRYGGVCDKDGCDFNSYRMGNTKFFGPGSIVDTNQKVTVVTQFITADGTDSGNLVEIRRVYVQNGKVIPNSQSSWPQFKSLYDSVTDNMCKDTKSVFGDTDDFTATGGLTAMGQALDRGMVLVMSVWSDTSSNMLWLDSLAPSTGSASTPGVARGPCDITSGVTSQLVSKYGSATVSFSNVKWGTIGSTFNSAAAPSVPTAAPSVPTAAPAAAPSVPTAAPAAARPTAAPAKVNPTAAPAKAKPTAAPAKGNNNKPTVPPAQPTKPSNKGPVPATAAPANVLATPAPVVPTNLANSGNVVLTFHKGSNNWWLAVALTVRGVEAQDVTSVELMDGGSYSAYSSMQAPTWGYWIFTTTGSSLIAPLTFRIVSSSGAEVAVQVPTLTAGASVDTGKTF